MEKKFKLIISPERCDAEALAHFIAELERLKLGVLTNGEIVYDDKNEKEVFNLLLPLWEILKDISIMG